MTQSNGNNYNLYDFEAPKSAKEINLEANAREYGRVAHSVEQLSKAAWKDEPGAVLIALEKYKRYRAAQRGEQPTPPAATEQQAEVIVLADARAQRTEQTQAEIARSLAYSSADLEKELEDGFAAPAQTA